MGECSTCRGLREALSQLQQGGAITVLREARASRRAPERIGRAISTGDEGGSEMPPAPAQADDESPEALPDLLARSSELRRLVDAHLKELRRR